MYVPAKTIAQEIEVSSDTLRNWADNGLVRCQRINGTGKRFYHHDDVRKMFGQRLDANEEKIKIAYARVSSAKQQEDLQRQVEALKHEYPNHEVVKDVGSGLNWKRKGLQGVLERAFKGMVSEVVVMHKDRLCRFGYELVEFILRQTGTKLLVHVQGNDDNKTYEQELADDLLAVVTVFAARKHGKRKYANGSKARTKKRRLDTDDNEENSGVSNDRRTQNDHQVDGSGALDLQQNSGPRDGRADTRTAPTTKAIDSKGNSQPDSTRDASRM